jgi:hypothetical protein
MLAGGKISNEGVIEPGGLKVTRSIGDMQAKKWF